VGVRDLEGEPGAPERVDFFVSYTSSDRPWAEWIAWVLEAAGYSVLVQAWDFGPGANFVLEMDRGATISARTVAVLSPAFLESRYTAPEWAAAFREDPGGSGRKLLPVRVRECDPQGLLGSIVHVDVFGIGEDGARQRLLSAAGGERGKPSEMPRFPGSEGPKAVARPATGAAIWNVPPVSGRFVGRESLVSGLAERLSDSDAAALTQVQALHGLGGVGKTRVAIEYAHRFRERYDVVWWVRAENPLTLLGDYAALADALVLPEREEREQEARAAAVTAWLENHPRWLVVFDNAPSPDAVRGVMPQGLGGHVLITSRQHGGWRGIADPLPIDVWSREESLRFLRQRTGDEDAAAATAIAEALGDLPLAIEQAAAYVDSVQITLDGYRRRLQSQAPALFGRGGPSDYEHTIATTWELAFAQLEQDPGCAALMFCCAFYAPERIPRKLFLSEAIAGGMFSAEDGELELDSVISRILSFSLLVADETTLSMHRLVQHVIRNRLADRRDESLATAQQLLIEEFPSGGGDPGTWSRCERLLSHVVAVTAHAADAASVESALLLNRAGLYLTGRGDFGAAADTYERALKALEAVRGPEHPDTLTCRNNVASAYQEAGRLAEATPLYEDTLSARERILGPEHPDTLISANNLARAYRVAGRLAEATPLYEDTLRASERIVGAEHPSTLITRNNLAFAYQESGRLDEALGLYEGILSARERILGREHPDTLISRNNLASAYREAGRLDEAIPLLEDTLSVRERILGPEHPGTLTSRNNLASAYRVADRLAEAIPLLEGTLSARERVLGPEHPDTLISRNNLASAYQASERIAEAIALYEITLSVRERVLGPEHPDTLLSRNNLAHGYKAAGRPDEAVALYEQALADASRSLGADHRFTNAVRTNLEAARASLTPRPSDRET
jgi:tetratricopeptide (TPR) repeat protein